MTDSYYAAREWYDGYHFGNPCGTGPGDMGIIIEVKYAHDGDLDAACEEALRQIEHTGYEDDLEDDGIEKILKYGIACYKKRCRVALA